MGRQALVCVIAAVATALATGQVWASGVPTHQTFEPKGLALSFQLPADWGEDLPPDAGWSWQAIAPGYVAHMYVLQLKATKPVSAVAGTFVNLFRARAYAADPRAVVASSTTHVASNQAIEVVTRVHGTGPAGPDVFVDYTYGFEHGGLFFIINYSTTAKWLAKEKPAFDASIRSVTFPNVA